MSLRDRFRRVQTTRPAGPEAEAQAALHLAGKRGRAPISPPPNAGKAAAKVLRETLPRGGALGLNEMQRRWSEIVGPPFAGKTTPEKLVGGVLTLQAPGALAPFLQQQAPLLIERLKLAGAKVSSVRIEQRAQGPVKAPNVRPLHKKLTVEEENSLAASFAAVEDPSLKKALIRLGRAVKQG